MLQIHSHLIIGLITHMIIGLIVDNTYLLFARLLVDIGSLTNYGQPKLRVLLRPTPPQTLPSLPMLPTLPMLPILPTLPRLPLLLPTMPTLSLLNLLLLLLLLLLLRVLSLLVLFMPMLIGEFKAIEVKARGSRLLLAIGL